MDLNLLECKNIIHSVYKTQPNKCEWMENTIKNDLEFAYAKNHDKNYRVNEYWNEIYLLMAFIFLRRKTTYKNKNAMINYISKLF